MSVADLRPYCNKQSIEQVPDACWPTKIEKTSTGFLVWGTVMSSIINILVKVNVALEPQ